MNKDVEPMMVGRHSVEPCPSLALEFSQGSTESRPTEVRGELPSNDLREFHA